MDNIIFFDGRERETLLPLTYLRPTSHIRVGMTTIEEKWTTYYRTPISHLTPPYLSALYPLRSGGVSLYINGSCLPNDHLVHTINTMSHDQVLYQGEMLVAFKSEDEAVPSREDIQKRVIQKKMIEVEVDHIQYPEDILNLGTAAFIEDVKRIDRTAFAGSIDPSVRLRGEDILVADGVEMYDCIINAKQGPVVIDEGAEIMEGAVLKGPIYIGKGTKVHVGAKIYADTYLGPQCRVGGEIKRTTMIGYANKAHDGYLGDSVLGMWCNLGADTNNSNMKNTYGLVSLWDIDSVNYRTTDRQFLGMILGDHTMSAINTSFNTGSVTGIFSNILDRMPERYTPSFSWGKSQKYDVDKAVTVARTAMRRRSLELSAQYETAVRYLATEL